MLGTILKRARSCCDLACGTGSTAVALAKRGLKVYAVDLSPTMCELAQKKALREHAEVEVIEADMRRFRLPVKVDLITCEFDALNHDPPYDRPRPGRQSGRPPLKRADLLFRRQHPLAIERCGPLRGGSSGRLRWSCMRLRNLAAARPDHGVSSSGWRPLGAP